MDFQSNRFYHIISYGCQANMSDSEHYAGQLEELGYHNTEDLDTADVILINTCCVRETAEDKTLGKIGELKHLKKQNPDLIIAVTGCMAQEWQDKLFKRAPHIDLVIGTHNIHKLIELIRERRSKADHYMAADMTLPAFHDMPVKRFQKFFAWIPIMNGCNKFCTYCIVPYVRGREVSRPIDAIVEEIKKVAAEGYKEITLLGQNVNSYGKNLEKPITFAELLQQIEQIEGLERIRFMTSHPKDLSDELIEVMKHSRKICRHLHLPLQSGSSRILNLMNRKYTKEQYLTLAAKIKEAIPDISLTTDIIVGFPGETEEDFEETMDVVQRVRYDSAFTFIYSKRTGTPAASMEDQVPEDVVKERFDRLLKEVQAISAQVCGREVHTVQEVLVEEPDDHEEGFLTGRLSNNTIVHFPGSRELIGKIVKVYLEQSKGFYYMGRQLDAARDSLKDK